MYLTKKLWDSYSKKQEICGKRISASLHLEMLLNLEMRLFSFSMSVLTCHKLMFPSLQDLDIAGHKISVFYAKISEDKDKILAQKEWIQ